TTNNRIKQMPQELSAIDNAGSNFCVHSAKGGEGHLLYSMDVGNKQMRTERHIRLGRLTAIISFLLGTIIFGLYYLTSSSDLLFIGYGYILVAGLVNIVVIALLLNRVRKDQINRKGLLRTSGIMLLNIPVMLLYCWIAFILLNTMRITFTNPTQTEVSDIKVMGCSTGYIDKLRAGESRNVWVDISGDCTISISYHLDGERKEEIVVGYVTNSMGQKIEHRIGEPETALF
ncbi:hypothetical protein, partial [Cesiribacter sp. SM1]|uniref:hypothetical protein n=1 Tax=Cesiribacter sp. SM1 TaxID=2861196 RepID=UPI001CD2BD9F